MLKAAHGLRVTEEEEFAGLDVKEHGAPGYGGFIFELEEITVEEETTEKSPYSLFVAVNAQLPRQVRLQPDPGNRE